MQGASEKFLQIQVLLVSDVANGRLGVIRGSEWLRIQLDSQFSCPVR